MIYFTTRKRDDSFSKKTVKFLVKIDSKGRVLIPADIRKTFGLSSTIILEFSFRNEAEIKNKSHDN